MTEKPCDHQWVRMPGYPDRHKLIDRLYCKVVGCVKRKTVALQPCPRCVAKHPLPCHVCDGQRVIPMPHACICCGTRNLAKGKAMCDPCFKNHGWASSYVCELRTYDELEQEKALGL